MRLFLFIFEIKLILWHGLVHGSLKQNNLYFEFNNLFSFEINVCFGYVIIVIEIYN